MHVELVYDPGCPNVARAREVLATALRANGVPAVWAEWRTDDPALPKYAEGLGSPTILVNGNDVAPGPHPWAPREAADAPRARVYVDERGRRTGVPPTSQVTAAVLRALSPDVG